MVRCFYNDYFWNSWCNKKMKKTNLFKLQIIFLLPITVLIIICIFFSIYILQKRSPNEPPSALLGKDIPFFETKNLFNESIILNNKNFAPKNFTKQIAFNAIPHIDSFSDDGYTKEELKMIHETNKILGTKIDITATCVRIPVLVSHAESVNIEFENDFTIKKVKELLNSAEGCKVVDENSDGGYITPVEAEGKNETFISRIRKDNSKKNALNMWIVSDNLLRGAALNAVEIAEAYIKR